jgi:hypothetical protein
MADDNTLAKWTSPSSDSEQDKQNRTERMIKDAVREHAAFQQCSLRVYTKGSYPNNTNVRTDSDVDVAVQCTECCYWGEHTSGAHPPSGSYQGIWTPSKLRNELVAALKAKFPGQVDDSGSTAIRVNSSSARVDADVVPSFDYRYYFSASSFREGSKTFKKATGSIVNYPEQHLKNGRDKNGRTNSAFKKTVRIFKRVENAMVVAGYHREVPSYFVECLVYNCPDSVFGRTTWTEVVEGVITHVWNQLQGDSEPQEPSRRWLEVNECKYLFAPSQKWTRSDGRDFAKAAWNYLGYGG